jgi:uncharacterized protein YkwD
VVSGIPAGDGRLSHDMMRASFGLRPVHRASIASRRVRIGLALVALACGLACSVPSSSDPGRQPNPGAPPPSAKILADLLEATNAERARAGIPALATDGHLMKAAQIQAEQAAASGRLEHTLPEARLPGLEDRLRAAGYSWQAVGENLAFGQRNGAHAIEIWMQSPSHRANILSGMFTDVGAGYFVDPLGRPYYVQVFGKPR